MPDFNIRSDSVDVEQIMEQIRARIREKRGVDYTEQQIQELAKVKLEKFLDPRSVRSDLLDQFKKLQPAYEPPQLPVYEFEESTLYDSHRGLLRGIRRLLQPVLKLFFNPNPLIRALNIQSRLNAMYAEREARREAMRLAAEQMYFEILHNLVLEMTRTGIEVNNLRMRVESVSSRLEFNERRARALESVVAYKPTRDEDSNRQARSQSPAATPRPLTPAPVTPMAATSGATPVPAASPGQEPEGPGQRSRRRRRRRGRRGGAPAAAIMAAGGPPNPEAARTEVIVKEDLDN